MDVQTWMDEVLWVHHWGPSYISGLILSLCPANERHRYFCNGVSHWLGTNLESALYLNPSGVGIAKFQLNKGTTKAADVLAPRITRSSSAMVFTVQD